MKPATVEQLQDFWNAYLKPWLGVVAFVFWPAVFAVPAYYIHLHIQYWSDSSRGFLDGFASAAFIGAAVVYCMYSQPKTVSEQRSRQVASWIAFISVLMVLGCHF